MVTYRCESGHERALMSRLQATSHADAGTSACGL